jgi:hypothetical protein
MASIFPWFDRMEGPKLHFKSLHFLVGKVDVSFKELFLLVRQRWSFQGRTKRVPY